jgi:hypothetical protein
VKKVVTLLAGNFEADEIEAFSGDNGLLTFAADDDCPEFHKPPPQLCLLFLMGKLVSWRFQISICFL